MDIGLQAVHGDEIPDRKSGFLNRSLQVLDAQTSHILLVRAEVRRQTDFKELIERGGGDIRGDSPWKSYFRDGTLLKCCVS